MKSCSMLKQPWGLGKEAWLRDSLFVSSHPAFLSHVLNYLSSQNLEQEELSAAWLKLSEENSAAEFVNTALTELPAIVEFVATFSKPVSSKVNSSDQDSQSMCSRPTISSKDSGVFSSTQKDNDVKGVKRRSQEGEKHARVERKKVQAAPPPSRAARMVESCISSNGKAGSTNSKGKKPVQEASRNKTETVKLTVKPMLSRGSRMVNTSRNSRKTAKDD